MKVSIVIPNYNGLENLKTNLPHVMAAAGNSNSSVEIIVVDDASTDKSVDYLKEVKIIQNPQNIGFAESCNRGVKEAAGEIVILLNTDVFPDKNFIDPLVKHFEQDKNVFAVGCLEKVLNDKDEIIEERGVGKLFFKNGIFQHRAGDLNSAKTDWVCGGSGAFRKDLFLALGGFNAQFKPFYWEDIDLSYRAKKAGYQLLFERSAVVYHKHYLGAISQKYTAREIEKISFTNQIKFTKKHAVRFNQKVSFLLFFLKHLLKGKMRLL